MNVNPPSSSPGPRPQVFIASSLRGLRFAQVMQLLLDEVADVEVWNQGVFGGRGLRIDRLLAATARWDLAVVVVTDDVRLVREDRVHPAPTPNLQLELGLFLGALGPRRTVVLTDRECPAALPSDLDGLDPIRFTVHRSGNLRASLGAASSEIAELLRDLGPRESPSEHRS